MKKLILLTIFFSVPSLINAQEVDIIGLEMRKQLTPNDRGLFIVGFRVQDQKQFTGISHKSKVLSMVDDTGFDILEAHKKTTDAARSPIVFDESGPIPNNKGFLVLLRSLALPSQNTKEIQLKAEIIFTVLKSDSLESTTIENIVLADTTALSWQGNIIPVEESKYRDSVKGDMYKYRLENEDLGVAVKKIEAVDADGNVIKELELSLFPDRIEFSLSQIETDESINLKISYKRLISKKVMIDKKIDLGL